MRSQEFHDLCIIKHTCRVLKEKLSKVDLSFLNHKKKMAFWINTYNACVMNVIP